MTILQMVCDEKILQCACIDVQKVNKSCLLVARKGRGSRKKTTNKNQTISLLSHQWSVTGLLQSHQFDRLSQVLGDALLRHLLHRHAVVGLHQRLQCGHQQRHTAYIQTVRARGG